MTTDQPTHFGLRPETTPGVTAALEVILFEHFPRDLSRTEPVLPYHELPPYELAAALVEIAGEVTAQTDVQLWGAVGTLRDAEVLENGEPMTDHQRIVSAGRSLEASIRNRGGTDWHGVIPREDGELHNVYSETVFPWPPGVDEQTKRIIRGLAPTEADEFLLEDPLAEDPPDEPRPPLPRFEAPLPSEWTTGRLDTRCRGQDLAEAQDFPVWAMRVWLDGRWVKVALKESQRTNDARWPRDYIESGELVAVCRRP